MKFNNLLTRLLFMVLICLSAYDGRAQTVYQTINDIPNPKVERTGSVSNPDGILSETETDSLNKLLAQLEQKQGVETAVVVIHNFNTDQDDFNFAVNLFKKWGIGRKKADNGLLLLVATDRKAYRFITGYGLEGLLPDADLKLIGEREMVPAFKQGNYGQGVVKAITTISSYLNQPANHKELADLLAKGNQKVEWQFPAAISGLLIIILIGVLRIINKHKPPAHKIKQAKKLSAYDIVATVIGVVLFLGIIAIIIISGLNKFAWFKTIPLNHIPWLIYDLAAIIILTKYIGNLGVIRRQHQDDFNFNDAERSYLKATWWCIIFSPPVVIVLLAEYIRLHSSAKRFTAIADVAGKPMIRVDRDMNTEGKPYLTPGQRTEEKLDVYCYDIWVSGSNDKEFKVIQNQGTSFGSHDVCPQCGFKTLKKAETEVLVHPTYAKQGEGKKVRQCEQCDYEELIKMVVIATLSQSNNSSSSGSGGSSSSDSGSYGGGDTGGGGAGGSW